MLILVLAPILLAYSWWLGTLLFPETRLSIWEKRWLAPTAGFAILIGLSTTLSFMGFLYPIYIYGGLAFIGVVAAGSRMVRRGGVGANLTPPTKETDPGPPKLLKRLTLSTCVFVGIHTFLCALTPEVRSDPVRYHISMANQYAVRGGIEPLRETVWWSVPQYAECLYALGIALANDTLSKLFHWWAGVLATLGVFALSARWFGMTAAYWAVLLWVTTPMVSYEATTTYVELILTVWILVSIWSAGRALDADHPGKGALWLLLSGLALGLAFGTKYTAFGVQGLAWLLFPLSYAFRWRGMPIALGGVLLSCAFVGVGYAPWFLRNLLLNGNPVYPLYNHLFGLTKGVDQGAELYFLTVWPGDELLQVEYYWEKALRFFHSGYNFPGIALVIAVSLALLRARGRNHPSERSFFRPELGFCLVSLAGYVFLTKNNDGRFWLPTLAVFLPFLGEGLARFLRGAEGTRFAGISVPPLITATLVVFCLYNYVGQRVAFFRNFGESPWPILSEEARWNYYSRHERGDSNGRIIEKLIPPGAAVYGLRFPERVRSVSMDQESLYDREGRFHRSNRVPLLDPFMESDRSPEAFLDAAASAGVEYIVLPDKEKPKPEEFWEKAAQVGVPVEGGGGRLLRIPKQQSAPESNFE